MVLLHEDEVDGGDEAQEGGEVVPVELFAAEEYHSEEGEDDQGDGFLQHFELR